MPVRMTAAQANRLQIVTDGAETLQNGTYASETAHSQGISKYRNRKTVVDGLTFDSAAEARRYGELKMLEKAGEITALECHPAYDLMVNDMKVGRYTADFRYLQKLGGYVGLIVEDVKSPASKTTAYRLRKRLMLACHGIIIKETR